MTASTPTRIALALALATGLGCAQAQTPPAAPGASAPQSWQHHRPMHRPLCGKPHGDLRMLLRDVHASAAQRAQIRAIVRDAMQQAKPEREQLRDLAHRELQLLAADPIDRDAVLKLAQQRQTVLDQLAQDHVRTELAVATVLTPQQRQQAQQLLQRRMHPMHGAIGN